MLIGDLPFSYEWLWTHLPGLYWNRFRELRGKKFYWQDSLLGEIGKWYRNKNINPGKLLKDLTTKDIESMADMLVFAHEKDLAGKGCL
jgi:hypothetical protein